MIGPCRACILAAWLATLTLAPAWPVSGARTLAAGAGDYFLIERATVIAGDPGSPEVLSDAQVIVRRGLIEKVGVRLVLPADIRLAERIDAAGLTLHPAFIDAWTLAGVAARDAPSRNADAPQDEREGPAARMREARRDGILPERSVLDAWDPQARELEAFRRLGFGAAQLAHRGGYLAGKTALVALGGGALRSSVVRPVVASQAQLRFEAPGYPNSLMGVIATFRQTLLDAARYEEAWRLYRRDPRGLPRPPYDTALEALAPLASRAEALAFEVDGENDVRRVSRLAGDLGIDLVVVGGREAYRAVEDLRARRARVLLVPDLPDKPEVKEEEGAPPRRAQEERLERWRADAGGAVKLKAAGVPFAFGSGAKADPERLLRGVRLAVEEGLSRQDALRALTLGAAEAVGAADVLGSVAEGKAASFVLRRGEPLASDSRVRYLFIDGVKFEFPEAAKPPEARPAEPAPKPKEEPRPPEAKPPEAKPPEAKPPEAKPPEAKPPEASPAAPGPAKAPAAAATAATRTELDADRAPRLKTGGNVLIRGGTVLTCAGHDLPEADVRVVAGKIEAVGKGLEPRPGMAVLDASGWFVMPGIIDCHSHIAADGGVNEGTQSVTAEVRIRDVLDPQDVALYRVLAGGVTTSNILHGSANTIGGQTQVIRNRYRAAVEDLPFPGALPGVKFALGENPRQSNFGARGSRFPMTRSGVEAVIYRAFAEAEEYRREWAEHAAALAAGARRLPPRRDLRLEALLEILEGRRVVHAHCYRADEIVMLLRAVKRLGIKLATLQHVLEGYKVAPEIAAAGAGASTFSDWWAYKVEAFDAIPYNAAIMTRAGVSVSINSDDAEMARHLNLEAAKTVRSGGLGHEEALRLITRNPAAQLGILDRAGTIEVGKDADIAVFDAHPLSVYARCRYTLIEGEVFFERGGERANPNARPLSGRGAAGGTAAAEEPPPLPPRNPEGLYLLRGARVVPVGAPPLERGAVLLRGGRIERVAAEIEPPGGATVIDLEGLSVYPGFIDAASQLGLLEIDSVAGTADTREIGRAQPDLVAGTAVNAHSDLIPVARTGGITAVGVFTDGPLIAGQASVVRLAGASTGEMVYRARAALHVRLPPGAAAGRRGAPPPPAGMEEPPEARELEEWFRRARAYLAEADAARREGAPPPPRDPELEALGPYAARELPVVFSADSEAAIRLAVKLAERLGVRGVLRGGRDAWRVAALLGEKDMAVILGPSQALPLNTYDPYDAPYACAAELDRSGVRFAFQSQEPSLARNLAYQAGTAVAFGLPHERALRALTLGAAELLGVERELGSLEPGKLGDLFVADGDPLEVTTRVLHVFIGGEPVSLETRHTRLHRQFRDRLKLPPGQERRF